MQLRHRQTANGVDFDGLASRLRQYGKVRHNEYMLFADVRDGGERFEITLFPDGRAIVKGTDDPSVARGVYAKFVGG